MIKLLITLSLIGCLLCGCSARHDGDNSIDINLTTVDVDSKTRCPQAIIHAGALLGIANME